MRITESHLRKIIRQELISELAPATGAKFNLNKLFNAINPDAIERNITKSNNAQEMESELLKLAKAYDIDLETIKKYKNQYLKMHNLSESDSSPFGGLVGAGAFLGGTAGAALNAVGALGGDMGGFATRLSKILGSGAVDPEVIKSALTASDISPGLGAGIIIGAALGAIAGFILLADQ